MFRQAFRQVFRAFRVGVFGVFFGPIYPNFGPSTCSRYIPVHNAPRMITAEQLRELAQRASVDERTAARFMLGLRVRPLAWSRLAVACDALGMPYYVTVPPKPAAR